MRNQSQLSMLEASKILKVSQATIRNWIKAGLLSNLLTFEEIDKLQKDIIKGRIQKLNSRANKINSKKIFVPKEYTKDKEIIKTVTEIINISTQYFKNLRDFVFNISLSYLKQKGEISLSLSQNIDCKRKAVFLIINNYRKKSTINHKYLSDIEKYMIQLVLSDNSFDILGLLYQSFISEGKKSVAGSYYTPSYVIEYLISSINDKIKTFLDPCCGTGNFLLNAAKLKNLDINDIYGVDIDENAVFIAKINMLVYFKNYDQEPNIYCLDSLNELATGDNSCSTNFLISKIDAVSTNPPWGASKNRTLSLKYEKLLRTKEIFSMFIAKSIEIIKDDGECSFLLPKSFLNIKSHSSIRELLCNQTRIISIKEFGKIFTGVYSPVVSVHFKKGAYKSKHKVKIEKKTDKVFISQNRFCKSKDYIFQTSLSPVDISLIDKIYSIKHKTLKDNAKWTLGIVTGNNKKYLQSNYFEGSEPIYKGSDVLNFRLKKPSNFIKYEKPNFQQSVDKKFYQVSEKLIYKFISDKLVFAYDDTKSLTLNSANILIPLIPEYSIKIAMGFLNSKVFQYIFSKTFSTHKVLKDDLEQLPFPVLSDNNIKILNELIDKAIKGENNKHLIDKEIYKIFRLNDSEIDIIEKSVNYN